MTCRIKSKRLGIIIFVFVTVTLTAPNILNAQTTWEKCYGAGRHHDRGNAIIHTIDGAYIIVGSISNRVDQDIDVYVVKISEFGDTLWTRTYGGSDYDEGYSVVEADNATYLIAGYTESYGSEKEDVYLIKINSDGDTLWTKTLGGNGDDCARSIIKTEDGGYVIAGYTDSFTADNRDVYLIKTDRHGDSIWTKTYGGRNSDSARKVIQTKDGGYIIAGNTVGRDKVLITGLYEPTTDLYIIKTDRQGIPIVTKNYVELYNEDIVSLFCKSLIPAEDEGYIIAGYAMYDPEAFLMKVNPDLELSWLRTHRAGNYIHTPDHWNGCAITHLPEGGYILAVEKNSIYGSELFLIKTDSYGDTVWTITIEEWTFYNVESIALARDGGYVITGGATPKQGYRRLFSLKTDSKGRTKEILTSIENRENYHRELKYYKNSNMGYEGSLFLTDGYGRPSLEIYVRVFAKNRKITHILLKMHNVSARDYFNFISFAPMIEFRENPANRFPIAFCLPRELRTKKLYDLTYVEPGDRAEYLFHFEDGLCQPYPCNRYSTIYSISEILRGEARLVIQVDGILFSIDNLRKYSR